LAISDHEELHPGNETDRYPGSGQVAKLVFLPLEAEGPILFHGSLIMERKHEVQILGGIERPEFSFAGLESLIPPFSGYFFSLQMNPLLVVEADHVRDDLASLDEVTDFMPLTEIGYATLEVIKRLFNFSFRFRRRFGRVDQADINRSESPLELDFGLIQSDVVTDMNAVMLNKAEDLVLIDVVGLRPAVTLHGCPNHAQMLKTPFFFKQLRLHKQPRIVVFGQDQMLGPVKRRNPSMLGAIVLEEEPRARCFEPDKNLLLFLWTGMVVSVPKSKGSKRSSLKRMTKGFFRLLGENGKVKSAPIHHRSPLYERQFLMQPAFLLAWQAMKSALPPTVQRERLFPMRH
jgi:hypothetical protein